MNESSAAPLPRPTRVTPIRLIKIPQSTPGFHYSMPSTEKNMPPRLRLSCEGAFGRVGVNQYDLRSALGPKWFGHVAGSGSDCGVKTVSAQPTGLRCLVLGTLVLGVAVGATGCRSAGRPSKRGPGEDGSASTGLHFKIEVREYTDEDGNLAKTLEGYVDTDDAFVPHGREINYRPGGKKKSQLTWVHGVRHGPAQAWYETGQLWWSQEYANDRENGTMTVWFIDGRKAEEYTMVQGAWHGKSVKWHPNGQKAEEVEFVHGRKQGLLTTWDEFGAAIQQIEYVDDKPQP